MSDRTLLIVEDDADFARTLKRSFERRDYAVSLATSLSEVDARLHDDTPDYAVVDLKLGTESGLNCVKALAEHSSDTIIVVLTGYASIATAVEAIKLGATHYLPKPANSDDIEAAFGRTAGDTEAPMAERETKSVKTLEWERIHQTLAETDFNISETARRLGMHRRTLARKLEKRRVS
ncbi:response regulator transcription factor [Stakelama marina]|uniref:Response regulator transcription factor n=1 Tax=Stakelama marina TaxID=2826939 RepID=A0A8T4I9G6_9SPHN|nr:response regulator transcription factor [Stakelama marina]MBR0550983.1 response regulator transcription factor [Stakelama marina]